MSHSLPKGNQIPISGVQWLLYWTGLIQTSINLWGNAREVKFRKAVRKGYATFAKQETSYYTPTPSTFGQLIAFEGIYRLKH